ncbi:MAG: coproporphyrinogen III oxidase family protein [Candidatus Saccharicenans sp.]|jgi:oxygen-independent coproporphyrinogen-3 oxidase|nr:coproporphyrinogen III oxidase family protein [Candidatus Saccharicenans sp.]
MKCEFNWPENINIQYRDLIKYYDLIKTYGFSIDPLSYDFVYSHIPVGRLYKANDKLLPGKIFKEFKEESTFYIHIPFCQRRCAYCYFVKEPFSDSDALKEYLDYLKKEVDIVKQLIKKDNIKSIYIGGGSPSILNEKQIEFLFNNIIAPIKTDGIEIAVELHPENTTKEKLKTLKENGVTRVSLGVQTFDDTILSRMNRCNGNLKEVIELVKSQFDNWNVDMIYGLPGQTPCIIEKDIEKILQYDPPSLTWYQLWYAPRKKDHQILMSKFPREAFMSREEIIKTRLLIDTKMREKDYKNYSGEWYVKNNNNYTTYERFKIEAKGNIGIGLGIYQYYGDYIFENTEDLNEYKYWLDQNILPIKWYRRMSPAEKTIRKICMNIKGLDEAGSINEEDLGVLKTGFQDYKIEKFLEKINILIDKKLLISDNNCQYKLNPNVSILRDYIIKFLLKDSGWYIEREGFGESLNKIDLDRAIESFVRYAKANFRQDVRWSLSLFFGIFDDTRNKFDLFFSKNYKNIDRDRPEIAQYREPNENDFSFLKAFYLPPSYISGPVCIVCRHNGNNISLDVPFIKVENEFKADDINQFLKSVLIFEDVDNKSLNYVDNYYLSYLPNALALETNETFFVFHIPFFEALGIGGIELAINKNLSRDQLNNMRDLLIPYFADRLSLEINRYSNHVYRLHALKNALASIMARNMSHNIDSHVSPRARLDQVRARLTELDGCRNDIEVLETLKNRLDEYRQKRSDFLAEITSDPLLTTKSVWFYKDIIIPLIQNTLFMDNIAKNEGICYGNKNKNEKKFHNALTINVRIKGKVMSVNFKSTNKTVKYPDKGYPYDNFLDEDLISFYTLGDPDSDVEIEVPGPVGEHAFYGLLENFIRNSAKHNQLELSGSEDKVLKVDIEITDPNDEAETDKFYLIKISDNISFPCKAVSLKIDGKEYNTLIDIIRAYIKTPIIDGSGKKRDLAYGLSEMKIDATLLRGSVDFMNMENFLDVRAEDNKLVYEFKLMKPKKLCLVMSLDMNDKKERIANLKKHGIWVFNSIDEVDNLFAFTDSHEDLNSVSAFKFVLIDCSNLNISSNLIQLIHNFPFRVILLNYYGNDKLLSNASRVFVLNNSENIDELKKMISGENTENNNIGEKIMEWVWANWLTRWKFGNAGHKVLELYLEQNLNESPTKEWIDSATCFNKKNNDYKLSLRVWGKDNDETITCPGNTPENKTIFNGNNTLHIYYDRHGAIFQGIDRQFSFGSDSYNLLDKLNKDFSLIFAANPLKQKTLIYELIESGLLRILIIDERLAERSVEQVNDTDANLLHNKVYQGNKVPRLWHIASAANIYICTHFGCNETNISPLHANSYEREIRKTQDSIAPVPKLTFKYNNGKVNVSYQIQEDNGNSTELKNIDMLVIHQGITDKRLNGVSADKFFDNISSFIPWVIIESGRGIPPNLPKYIKFLPYSIIDDLISNKRIAKYRLSQLVMSLSKQKG